MALARAGARPAKLGRTRERSVSAAAARSGANSASWHSNACTAPGSASSVPSPEHSPVKMFTKSYISSFLSDVGKH